MRKLYLECFTGISGDMTVAALLDLGADEKVLRRTLQSLSVDGFEIKISRVKKAGLDVCDFDVILDEAHENHDHDMAYLYGKTQEVHEHEHEHHHQGNHPHEHRGLGEIVAIIENADMTPGAKKIAEKIFYVIAEAEAKAHGATIETVHFHEVGAVDSIVDVIAVAVCVDNLGISDVIVPVLYEGSGQVRCQHGILPIPVPAVLNIVTAYGLPLHVTDTQGELVTPTGAAIVAALCTKKKLPKQFTIEKIGLGAGKRAYEKPGILRAMLLEEQAQDEKDTIYKLESNIDDCTGEALGFVMDRLFEAGARDVHYMPVFMKKSRPAYQLNVICAAENVERLEKIIFTETTTIGIRKCKMERSILKRSEKKLDTALGEISYKVCELPEGKRYYPEYESLAKIGIEQKKSYQEVYQFALQCSRKYQEGRDGE